MRPSGARSGFPTWVRARATKAKKREQRLRLERIQAAKRFSPFAMIDDLSSYDDLSWSIL